MMELHCLEPSIALQMWRGPIHSMIDAAFEAADRYMPDDIQSEIASGKRLIWVAVDDSHHIVAAMMTTLYKMRSGLVCKMLECGGEGMNEWKQFRDRIEQYAKSEGCVRVMAEGRPGWARVLDDYKTTAVVLEKVI